METSAPQLSAMKATEADQPAPGELELLRRFVNTLDIELHTDELTDGAAAARWFSDAGVPVGSEPFTADELKRLIEFREALRSLLLANNSGEPPDPAALRKLNDESGHTELGLRFGPDGAALETRCDGVDCAIARMLAIAHDAMHDGIWNRLKACPAEDCHWAFYDRSRNRSGTWCYMGACGNRAKARAFRERQRAAATR